MEMEMEVAGDVAEEVCGELAGELGLMGSGAESLVERLQVVASLLEQAAGRLAGLEVHAAQASHEADLEGQLAAAEATIASLQRAGRKTSASGVVSMVAKEGAAAEAGALDAALVGLSVEQRIAVKAGLMRAGLAG